MTDRPHDDARRDPGEGFHDPTRDIRLPPIAGRPAPVVPPEWAGVAHAPEQASGARAEEPTAGQPVAGQPAASSPRTRIADQPTDELGDPSAAVRQRTLAFAPHSPPAADAGPAQGPPGYLPPGHPEPGGAAPQPAARPAPPRRRRSTWPWVLALLVLLALFAAAVVLVWVGGEKDNLQSFWEAGAPLGYHPG